MLDLLIIATANLSTFFLLSPINYAHDFYVLAWNLVHNTWASLQHYTPVMLVYWAIPLSSWVEVGQEEAEEGLSDVLPFTANRIWSISSFQLVMTSFELQMYHWQQGHYTEWLNMQCCANVSSTLLSDAKLVLCSTFNDGFHRLK